MKGLGQLALVAKDRASLGRPEPRLSEANNWLHRLAELRRSHWVVYAKPPFGRPEGVLKYLSRYTHRVAIANDRIRFAGNSIVRFVWKDYADHKPRRELPLQAEEFLRRLLLRVMPCGFMRIRHYGIVANRHRERRLVAAESWSASRQILSPQESLPLPDRDPQRDAPDELATERPLPPCAGHRRLVCHAQPRCDRSSIGSSIRICVA